MDEARNGAELQEKGTHEVTIVMRSGYVYSAQVSNCKVDSKDNVVTALTMDDQCGSAVMYIRLDEIAMVYYNGDGEGLVEGGAQDDDNEAGAADRRAALAQEQ